ncbi:MAG TPA: bifunctional UDP-N-acetylglucosamine diphosphorylase/glucosamine-1-phosphate N-acetyltransferase GlmU [Acetobacteraceae bacterium]|nr:bifunctional UDP-N-acetylglucosamine diphosphorylase/glucosamine-1-phosphate N-acetyltransferase GlmU [Acetobacteraceae bacterium]
MTATAVILAAGIGSRMKSALPKALHPIAGRPMLRHLLANCEAVFDRVVVVVGPEMEAVSRAAAPHPTVIQAERRGTAHAARQAKQHFGDGEVAILYADNPLIRPDTLRRLLGRRARGDVALALLASRRADPAQYGRVIARDGLVERVIEHADATEEQRAITLCNGGVLCATAADMRRWLDAVRADNAQGEFYLPDIVALARAEGARVAAVEAPEAEMAGINSRAELAAAEATVQAWLRAAALEAGVTMTDPGSVFLCADTELAPDVTIGPNVVFGPGVRIGRGTEIRPFSHLEGCVVGEDCLIGPFARLRPGTALDRGVHVGNFVELKAATLGAGAKANHLAYLGDTEVGSHSNIGAGTITCNYDGFAKHRTRIGANAFIGSDTALVAPVSVGDGAITGAGSVITRDVAADALAIARGQQVEKPGGGAAFRARRGRKER